MKYQIGQRVYFRRREVWDTKKHIWAVGRILDYSDAWKKYLIADGEDEVVYWKLEEELQSLSNATAVFDVVPDDIPKKKRDKGSIGIRAEEDFMPQKNSISIQIFYG